MLEAHPASIQDRDGGGPLLCASRGSFPFIEKVFADSGYAGEKVATATVIAVEIVRKSPDQVGFAVQPRRWGRRAARRQVAVPCSEAVERPADGRRVVLQASSQALRAEDEFAGRALAVLRGCYSAYVFDADRRANLLTSVESMGSKFGAEQQTPTDSRSSKCSARRPLRARSTSPDRASLRSAGTKPESTAPFRRRPCASRASSRPTELDRAPFAPGRPEKGILAPRRPPRTTPGLANARDSAPLAASTATVPAACASISRTTASEKSPPESRRSRLCQGQRI